ncbi:MAG TPA: class II SORL domain-containing protein [Spirochaetia bacterium]|nr:class II SORL domain-containing protein [Spirochaetia bacterium]
MSKIGDYTQTADFKSEKHAPVIECPNAIKAGEKVTISASVGKEIAHPNTTEHHISWIQLYFQPEGDKFTQQLSVNEFVAHGASAKGANQGIAFTEPAVSATVTLKQSGTIHALSYCNIHGLWESTKEIKVS